MIAARGDGVEPVPLEEVAGKKKLVPPDHSLGPRGPVNRHEPRIAGHVS